jgi:hypothetical protein
MPKSSKSTTAAVKAQTAFIEQGSSSTYGDDSNSMVTTKYKIIKVLPKTHEELWKLAEFKDESYDQIIQKCIQAYKEKKQQERRK